MSLKECLELFKNKFPQQDILLPEVDYSNRISAETNPKYLFRGERKIYLTTKSLYERLVEEKRFNEKQWENIKDIIFYLSVHLANVFHEVLERGAPGRDSIFAALAGYMQHYGFPIGRLDFTSDIEVAAFFASQEGIVGEKGRLYAIDLFEWMKEGNRFEKLNTSIAKRPIAQNAFSLVINLKNNFDLIRSPKIFWIEFEFQREDYIFYTRKNYLNTDDDKIAFEIRNYLKPQISTMTDKDVRIFFERIVAALN